MKLRKIFLNLLVFSILIGGFVFAYFNTKKPAEANTTLSYCILKVSPTTPNHVKIFNSTATGTEKYIYIDPDKYFVIDNRYVCPNNYQPFPGDFNLNLLKYASTTEIVLPDGDPSGSNNSTSTPPNDYDGIYYIDNDLQALYDSIIYGTPNYNNPNYNTPNYTDPNYYNNPNYYDPNYYNNPDYNNPNYNTPNYTDPNYYNNPNYNNSYYNSPNYAGDISGSGLNYQSLYLSSSFWDNLIKNDPSFTNGRFVTLDALDYPYCVNLTRNFGYGSRDGDTGREVSALQGYLYSRGYMDVEPTGYFGNITAISLGKFQYRNQITVTGSVNQEVRDIMKDLTCIKIPNISYKDKPLSPSPYVAPSTPSTVTKPPVVTPPKDIVIIPPTEAEEVESDSSISTLSSTEGNMYLSQRNNLYFMYKTKAPKPFICIDLNNTDCSIPANYEPIIEGVLRGYYEVVDLSGNWAFTLYNGNVWGEIGDKTKIYLKDSAQANTVSVYTVNVLN
ncbi:MAG: peptidoglycan-binding domain-containing protein [Candidatus Pacebacteria bacterium]|nr:peptidoglycan-binding domain-containing protein [Candidatus Paceibacterota bacterium]